MNTFKPLKTINTSRIIKCKNQEKLNMYGCICIDLACFNYWQGCILTQTYLLKTMGGFLMVESGWRMNFEFSSFLRNFGKVRVSSWARVSCCLLVMLLSIYRENLDGKESEKRLINQCAIFPIQIKSNIGKNLIFSSMQRLARIWQLLWAFLDSKHDIKSFLLKKYFIFIFYII